MTKTRPEHLQRMDIEEEQLRNRIEKGTGFLHGEARKILAPLDITLLAAQIDSMRAYHTVLLLRIQREEAQL